MSEMSRRSRGSGYFHSSSSSRVLDERDIRKNDSQCRDEATSHPVDSHARIRENHARNISQSSAASGDDASANLARRKLRVHTRHSSDVPPGTKPVRSLPDVEGEAQGSGRLGSKEVDETQPQTSGPSKKTKSTKHGYVTYQEYEELGNTTIRKIQKLQKQISIMTEEAQKKDREHAEELREREREAKTLKQSLELRNAVRTDQDLSNVVQATMPRDVDVKPKEPRLYQGDQGGGDGSPDDIQYLYDGFLDQLTQTTLEMWILRAEMAEKREDWDAMFAHAGEALIRANKLNYFPISARCAYYRGIARFQLRQYWEAEDEFNSAQACVGVYKTEQDFSFWTHEITKAQQRVSPAQSQPRWYNRIYSAFSRPGSRASPQPSLKDSTTSPTPASRALKDELGSAMYSATFPSASLEVPLPYRSEMPPPPLPEKGARPSSAIERRLPSSSQALRPVYQRMSTLQALSGQQARPQINPLQEHEAFRQRQIAPRRSRASTLISSMESIPERERESPANLARDVKKIDSILRHKHSESLRNNSTERTTGYTDQTSTPTQVSDDAGATHKNVKASDAPVSTNAADLQASRPGSGDEMDQKPALNPGTTAKEGQVHNQRPIKSKSNNDDDWYEA